MSSKPILLWPKPTSEIASRLGSPADDFLVVDTNCIVDLQKLYKLSRDTPILDPFPRSGEHYRAFKDHLVASSCTLHVVGLSQCRNLQSALKDPSLARAPIEELVAVIAPARNESRDWRTKFSFDWSRLSWMNTILVALFVFAASAIGNAMFVGDGIMAAIVTTLILTALYVLLRLDARYLRSAKRWRPHRADI